MSMVEGFDKQNNKAFLWNLMYEKNLFKDIQDKHVENVKMDFEEKIKEIKRTATSNTTLIQLNKKVISEMVDKLNKYKYPIEPRRVPITAEEVSQQNQLKFKTNLESLQTEFANSIRLQKPTDIDFSDVLDKPIGSEMDNMLATAIAMRENDLNIVLDKQDSVTGEEWINKDNTSSNTNKVSFETTQDSEKVSNDFISKLKKKSQPTPHEQQQDKQPQDKQPQDKQPQDKQPQDKQPQDKQPQDREIIDLYQRLNTLIERITLIENVQQEILERLVK